MDHIVDAKRPGQLAKIEIVDIELASHFMLVCISDRLPSEAYRELRLVIVPDQTMKRKICCISGRHLEKLVGGLSQPNTADLRL
jgi:hypothetical protein